MWILPPRQYFLTLSAQEIPMAKTTEQKQKRQHTSTNRNIVLDVCDPLHSYKRNVFYPFLFHLYSAATTHNCLLSWQKIMRSHSQGPFAYGLLYALWPFLTYTLQTIAIMLNSVIFWDLLIFSHSMCNTSAKGIFLVLAIFCCYFAGPLWWISD